MPMHFQQRTIAKPVSCCGIGVHSGKKVNLCIKPAPANHGIKFIRTDLADSPCIAANFNMVVDTSLATVIGHEGFIVSTIEHLMASFAGLSIDNAIVEINSYEVPIMDGSAGPFTSLIKSAGIKNLLGPKYFFVVKEPIELIDNEKSVCIFPWPSYKITYTIEYAHNLIKTQTLSIDISEQSFEHEISMARTFGFLEEYEYMKNYGLAGGCSLDNVVVIDKDSILNEGGLRYKDEFVRHKILDCLGDFSLLGIPLLGHVVINKSGHAFNHNFLKKFFSQKKSWETRIIQSTEELQNCMEKEYSN